MSGLFVFAVNLMAHILIASGKWVGTYGLTLDGPVEDFGPTVLVMVLIYPAFFTFIMLMVLFLFPSTRRVVLSGRTREPFRVLHVRGEHTPDLSDRLIGHRLRPGVVRTVDRGDDRV